LVSWKCTICINSPNFFATRMKKKSTTSEFGFFGSRVLVAVLFCTDVACLLAAESSTTATGKLAFSGHETRAKASHRTLSFAERVAYQRAIEEVYWRHRLWPKDNPYPRPSLDTVMTRVQVESKVADYLRKSRALEDRWQRPLTAEQLQAEMDRMAEHTRQPEVLRELFQALGSDPFVIAECLARPALAQRFVADPLFEQTKQTGQMFNHVLAVTADYTIPIISATAGGCADDTWMATSLVNVPSPRGAHTAVWTGSEMIIWGGYPGLNTGGIYSPSTDTWTFTSTTNAPDVRYNHTAVWTGSEMIVWGGSGNSPAALNSGGRYNPATDSWRATSITNAPPGRAQHTAVWTGTKMVVWGGASGNNYLNTGGRYNPNSDSWAPTSITNAPDARAIHTAVWTGSAMIVWGGTGNVFGNLDTGGRYNPDSNTWISTSTASAPTGRLFHTAIWTGTNMIVWGGTDGTNALDTGGRYDPGTNSWTATTTSNAPSGRGGHTAAWTGSQMIVWGGADVLSYFSTGGRYNPASDTWSATSTTNSPRARASQTAVWTGNEMIVWGGADDNNNFNTGGRYCASVSQLGNISTRAFVQTGDNVMIGGFIVQGTIPKRVIIRAIGPELGAPPYNIPNALANPTLDLHNGTGALIASNDNWVTTIIGGIITSNQVHDIMNSGHVPGDGRESAIIADLPPGNYTAIVRGVDNMTGVALVEVYDLGGDASSILGNISTRSFVQMGDNVMIGGFIVQGSEPKSVIIRAIGPELGAPPYNVPNALADPSLELHNGTGALIASNDNWQVTILGGIITTDQVQDIIHSGYAPGDPRESAIIAHLPPGNYTAIVRGVNNTTGVGLVEVYDLQ
jgi:N-acetylneuraminic acid mutarotase